MWTDLVQAASLGFSSAPHCVAMCAPLVGMGCVRRAAGSPIEHVSSYVAGRALSYGTLGALAGTLGNASMLAPARPWLRLAAELAVSFALARFGVRLAVDRRQAARSPNKPAYVVLRSRRSRATWVRELVDGWLKRVAALVPRAPFALGVSTALFPCGALGGALLFSASTASPWEAAASMTVFALTSAPMLVFAVLAGSTISAALSKVLRGGSEDARGARAIAVRAFRLIAATALVAIGARIATTALGAVIS